MNNRKAAEILKIIAFGCLVLLPFLWGGTGYWAELIIFALPLPILIMAWVFRIIKPNNINRNILYSYLGIVVWGVVSTFFSQNIIFSIPTIVLWMVQLIWLWIFFMLFQRKDSTNLIQSIVLAGGGLSILSLIFLIPEIPQNVDNMNLFYAVYGHNHIISYLLISIPLALGLIAQENEYKFYKYINIILLIFMLFAAILSFSRAGLLVLILGLVFWVKAASGKSLIKIFVIFFIISSSIALLITFFGFYWSQKIEITKRTYWLEKQVIKPNFDGNRLNYWTPSWKGVLDKPIVGYGPGNFEIVSLRNQNQPSSWSSYAHSYPIQLVSEIGLPGLFFIIFFYFFCTKLASELYKSKNTLSISISIAIIGSVVHSLVDYDWHFPAIFITFFALLTLANTYATQQKNPEDQNQPIGQINVNSISIAAILIVGFAYLISSNIGDYFFTKNELIRGLKWKPWDKPMRNQLFKIKVENETEALNLIDQLIRFSPGDPSTHYIASITYANLNMDKLALDHQLMAIRLNPIGNWGLYEQLLTKLDLNKDKAIIEEINNLIFQALDRGEHLNRTHKQFGKLLYQISNIYLKSGDLEYALEWLKYAKLTEPGLSFYFLEEASILYELGREEEARQVLTNCLEDQYASFHCRQYTQGNDGDSEQPLPLEYPGYWEKDILKPSR